MSPPTLDIQILTRTVIPGPPSRYTTSHTANLLPIVAPSTTTPAPTDQYDPLQLPTL